RVAGTEVAASPYDWPYIGGAPYRSAQGKGGTPFLEARWEFGPNIKEKLTREWVERAIKQHEAFKQPIVPASVPVAAGGRLVYRTFQGLSAYDLRTGKLA